MKKLFAVLTVFALIFALCACAAVSKTAPETTLAATPSPMPGADPTAAPVTTETPSDDSSAAELNSLLSDFGTHIQAGSAGSSLKAVQQAVRLMDWAAATSMTDGEIQSVVADYIAALDEEAREEYMMNIEALDYAYQQLLQPGQEELLDEAGCGDSNYPWGEEALPAVESLMSAFGRRGS